MRGCWWCSSNSLEQEHSKAHPADTPHPEITRKERRGDGGYLLALRFTLPTGVSRHVGRVFFSSLPVLVPPLSLAARLRLGNPTQDGRVPLGRSLLLLLSFFSV